MNRLMKTYQSLTLNYKKRKNTLNIKTLTYINHTEIQVFRDAMVCCLGPMMQHDLLEELNLNHHHLNNNNCNNSGANNKEKT